MNRPKNRTEKVWQEIDENIKKLTKVLEDTTLKFIIIILLMCSIFQNEHWSKEEEILSTQVLSTQIWLMFS